MPETKLGVCVICGSRVHKAEDHLKAREGYAHRNCIAQTNTIKA